MDDIHEQDPFIEQNAAPPPAPPPESAAPAVVESPLSKLLKAIFGGKPAHSKPSSSAAKAKPSVKKPPAKTGGGAAPAAAPAGVAGPLMTVVVRNEFYRDGFRNMMRIAIAEAVIIVVLVITFIVYMNASKPADHYFATTADGRIMQLVPLDRANMNTSALMSWVAQSSTENMTFGFHDYHRRMQQSSRHFTRHGWESFTNALQKSRIVESVEASQQVVTAQPRSAPVLVQEGVFNGKYRWVVDLPLMVSYLAGSVSRTDNLVIRLVVDRVPSLENPNGVGIEQWIATAAQQ
jgi:intracellular multiplication protein IcmL